MKGLFITFEGGEGSGKTTQIGILKETLQKRGIEVLATREPGGTALGEHIRGCLLNPEAAMKIGAEAELMLFLASRLQHIEEVIVPALRQNKVVICDRFNDSTIAYQGGGRGLGIERVQKICSLACKGFLPDLSFFLDLNPEEGFHRLRREKDRIEEEGSLFHQKVRDAFLFIAGKERSRVQVVNASQSKEKVSSEILAQIDCALAKT